MSGVKSIKSWFKTLTREEIELENLLEDQSPVNIVRINKGFKSTVNQQKWPVRFSQLQTFDCWDSRLF